MKLSNLGSGSVGGEDGYWGDIAGQPEALRHVITHFGRHSLFSTWADEWRRRDRPPLVLTGMGASLFAAEAAHVALACSGIQALVVPTADLVEYQLKGLPRERLILAISQSGRSIEMQELLDATDVDWAVTNSAGSALGHRANSAAVLGITSDTSVALKTYTCTLATLWILAAVLSPDGDGEIDAALGAAVDTIVNSLALWTKAAEGLADLVTASNAISFIGWGAGHATAREAALLFKEGARRASEGTSAAQFRHGAVEMVEASHLAIFFISADEDTPQHWAFVREVARLPGEVVAVGQSPPADLLRLGIHHVDAKSSDFRTATLTHVAPIQLLAAELAGRAGFKAGDFRNTTPVITTSPS